MVGAMLVVVGVAAGVLTAVLVVPLAARLLGVILRGYLGYVAFKIATAPPLNDTASPPRAPGFMAGFILNFSNPKAYAAFAALFSGFDLIPDEPVYATQLKELL